MSHEPTNSDRVQTAEAMLKARGARGYDPHDNRANLTDMLADLMHWADAKKLDLDECLDRARKHHLEEMILR